MKVIVIGSKGFIGSHLFKYLNKNSIEVWGADIISDNIDNYVCIEGENLNFDIVFSKGFDICVNCSGAANVPASIENPLRDYTLNTSNVFRMLESIKRLSPNCQFINLSSAAVYGNPDKLPIKEDTPVNPVSPYGWHKLQAEMLCKEFYDNFSIPTISLRIFSAYGEGLKKQLLWDVFQKSKKSTSIEFWGTGRESRDFIYIDDLISAIYLVMKNANFNGGAINIANGEENFIEDVISTVLQKLDWDGQYSFMGQNRKGDPTRWVSNIDKLKSLGYKKLNAFEKGVENYCNWVIKNNKYRT